MDLFNPYFLIYFPCDYLLLPYRKRFLFTQISNGDYRLDVHGILSATLRLVLAHSTPHVSLSIANSPLIVTYQYSQSFRSNVCSQQDFLFSKIPASFHFCQFTLNDLKRAFQGFENCDTSPSHNATVFRCKHKNHLSPTLVSTQFHHCKL